MTFDTAEKCKFDKSKNKYWKFPKNVFFQIAKKSELDSNEITKDDISEHIFENKVYTQVF